MIAPRVPLRRSAAVYVLRAQNFRVSRRSCEERKAQSEKGFHTKGY